MFPRPTWLYGTGAKKGEELIVSERLVSFLFSRVGGPVSGIRPAADRRRRCAGEDVEGCQGQRGGRDSPRRLPRPRLPPPSRGSRRLQPEGDRQRPPRRRQLAPGTRGSKFICFFTRKISFGEEEFLF